MRGIQGGQGLGNVTDLSDVAQTASSLVVSFQVTLAAIIDGVLAHDLDCGIRQL